MPRLRPRDEVVGSLKTDEQRPVFQCGDTGLLYVYADPPKRYVFVSDVHLGDLPKEKPCSGSKRPTTS